MTSVTVVVSHPDKDHLSLLSGEAGIAASGSQDTRDSKNGDSPLCASRTTVAP